jgi:hypothetical protein
MSGGSLSFYEVAAQVIPVLVLVLLVEQREDKRKLPPFWNLLYILFAILAAFVAKSSRLERSMSAARTRGISTG